MYKTVQQLLIYDLETRGYGGEDIPPSSAHHPKISLTHR